LILFVLLFMSFCFGNRLFQVSPEENHTFKEIESMLRDVEKNDTSCISPFPLLTTNAVESLRYRAPVCSTSIVNYIIIYIIIYILEFLSSVLYTAILSSCAAQCLNRLSY
jgi:hypothetical protein